MISKCQLLCILAKSAIASIPCQGDRGAPINIRRGSLLLVGRAGVKSWSAILLPITVLSFACRLKFSVSIISELSKTKPDVDLSTFSRFITWRQYVNIFLLRISVISFALISNTEGIFLKSAGNPE
ncbi:hypothetical protein D3C78_1370690 [compost metagenome]